MKAIEETLSCKKKDIIKKCVELTAETYPPETSELLKREDDRFLNPVGFTIRTEIGNIFDELAGAMDPVRLRSCLENIVKIRAVQNFTASEAVSFVYSLKRSVRDELRANTGSGASEGAPEVTEQNFVEALAEIDERIDRIALLAFDVYMGCREKIHEIRVKEIKAFRVR